MARNRRSTTQSDDQESGSKLTRQVGPFCAFPTWLLDDYLALFTPNEWKILTVVIRKTLGFYDRNTREQKETDRISYSQFQDSTGLDNGSISKALQFLAAHGFISADGNTWDNRGRSYTLQLDSTKIDREAVALAAQQREQKKNSARQKSLEKAREGKKVKRANTPNPPANPKKRRNVPQLIDESEDTTPLIDREASYIATLNDREVLISNTEEYSSVIQRDNINNNLDAGAPKARSAEATIDKESSSVIQPRVEGANAPQHAERNTTEQDKKLQCQIYIEEMDIMQRRRLVAEIQQMTDDSDWTLLIQAGRESKCTERMILWALFESGHINGDDWKDAIETIERFERSLPF